VSRELKIKNARKQLEEAKLTMITREDSLLIREKENLLNKAGTDLNTAKRLITLQKEEISNQRKLLFWSTGSMILLSIFLFIIYIQYKENRKTGVLLKEKNKKITNSINYAKRIQQSILPQENEIQKLLPHSFVFYQPRDIVSGDFYWFSELENKIIIAAVDCTGHGVSGAFMSLIGNTLLNGIINEKRIVDPSSILSLLHSGVLKALHQEEGDTQSQDGMEMSLCVIDNEKRMIEFAGAMTPIYIVNENILDVIQPDSKEIGGINSAARKNKKNEFTTTQIPIKKNMCVYMFTDGYMDQFGGEENKKFNTLKFKSLLLDIQDMDMDKQKQAIEKAMKDWKGDYRQIDDMLVIGIRF
jgi:serine phosphatase RsbU (regulator of sigma subunit)